MIEQGESKRSQGGRLGWDEYDKAEQVNATGCIGGEEEDPQVCGFIKKLRWDLANSYYWTGNFVRDYFFFVMQWHPLLGLIMCHPNHPWTKTQRFCMFMISVGLTFVPSVGISKLGDEIFGGEALVAAVSGEVVDVATITTTTIYNVQDKIRTGVKTGSVQTLTILFVTIPDTIIGVILYQLAIAETRCGMCPCCIPCGKCVLKYTDYFAVVICAIAFTIGMMQLHWEVPWGALKIMASGKVISWGAWFIIWMLLPCQLGYVSLWSSESKAEERARQAEEK